MIRSHHFKAQGLKDLPLRSVIDRYTIAELAAHLPVSETALVFCEENSLRTAKELYRAVRMLGGLLELPGCTPAMEQELRRLVDPPHAVDPWPPLEDPWERVQQHYAHLPKRCRTVLNTWLSQCSDAALGLQYLIHSDHPFRHFRGLGPDHVEALEAWRRSMRPIHAPPEAPIAYAALRGEPPGASLPVAPLQAVLQAALTRFGHAVLKGSWYGKEEEAVSYFAFAFLAPACRAGTPFHHAGQITLWGRVPGRAQNATSELYKDLVLWSEPGCTPWDEERQVVHYPLVVMRWKAYSEAFDTGHLKQLVTFTNGRPGLLGIAVTFDARTKRTLRAATVLNGQVDEDWLTVRASR